MGRLIGYLVATVTAVLNWYAFEYLAEWLGASDPSFVATMLLVSIVVHELGHLAVLEANGIRTYLVFLVILGGAIPDPRQKERFDALSWNTKAGIYLAGVAANILVIVAYGILYGAGAVTGAELMQVANLNGSLILFNLLPFGIFDGGRFTKVLFDSVSEDRDRDFVHGMAITIGIVGIATAILTLQFYFGTIYLIFWGLRLQSKRDDPKGSYDRRAMTVEEQRTWAGAYVFLVALGITLLSTTTDWLRV